MTKEIKKYLDSLIEKWEKEINIGEQIISKAKLNLEMLNKIKKDLKK